MQITWLLFSQLMQKLQSLKKETSFYSQVHYSGIQVSIKWKWVSSYVLLYIISTDICRRSKLMSYFISSLFPSFFIYFISYRVICYLEKLFHFILVSCYGVYYFVSRSHFHKRCVSSPRSTEEHFQEDNIFWYSR